LIILSSMPLRAGCRAPGIRASTLMSSSPADIEILLQLFQRTDVAGDERPIQFVSDLRGSFHADGDVNAAA
jgi:hypothetical protein